MDELHLQELTRVTFAPRTDHLQIDHIPTDHLVPRPCAGSAYIQLQIHMW